jgi:uncharacterized membrane protein
MQLQLEILETKSKRKGESCISFSRKTGVICVSSTAAKELHLKDGDRMAVAKDPSNEKDWYLIVFKDKTSSSGIVVRAYGKSGAVALNCVGFAVAFLDQFCERDTKLIKVPLATVPNEILDGKAQAYAILTKALDNA